jgi:UDPglucose--hexose-1-phosphate uridylyltransferase
MSQLRLDPLTGRWVVISADRADRPQPFAYRTKTAQQDPDLPCPFCPGNEEKTPPALETYGPNGGWLVRVVPNLYPAFSGRELMAVQNIGPVFTQAPASGIHEVVVFSPDHDMGWADLSDPQAGLVMAAIRDRIEEHARVGGLRYSQFIANCGREAGASLDHPHGQLLGMPFVPGELVDEQAGFDRFQGACLLCTTLEAEAEAGHRIVTADERVQVICPFWSGTPYEMLVLPRNHEPFVHKAQPQDLAAVGRAVRDALARLRRTVGDVAYNVVLHYSPFRASADFHWHVHLLPKVTSIAGFELGTGVLINVLPPEFAAAELRAAVAAASS